MSQQAQRPSSLLPLAAGIVSGLVLTLWTAVHAGALIPNLSLTSVYSGAVLSGGIQLSAYADAVGLSSIQFEVSGQPVGPTITSGACVTTWDTRSVPDGQYTVTALGRDSVGNSVWAPPALVTVNNSSGATDSTPPSVTITSPTGGAVLSGTATLTATATDGGGVAAVWFTLDGTPVGSEDATSPYQAAWNTTTASEGAHILQALARDAAGNVGSSAAVWVTAKNAGADTVAPSVSVTSPSAGSTLSGSITLAADAADNVGVASVQFTVDGSNAGSLDTVAPFQVTWATTAVANGSRTVRAVARDTAGNVTTSTPITITINNTSTDMTRPSVSMTSPSSGSTVSGTITMSATASDNVGVVGVQFTVDGANIGAEDNWAPYQIAWNTTSVANGARTVRAVARDAAGNTRTSTRTIVVSNSTPDVILPTVAFAAPTGGADVSGGVNLTVSAGDNVGVVGVQFKVDGVNLGQEDTVAPYQIWWNSTDGLNGRKNITAVARDAAGNTSTALVQVRVRNLGTGIPGDLDNDGFPDLVFRHNSGQLYSWFMRWGVLYGERGLTPSSASLAWRIVSLDDFDGDRKSDILLQHAGTGQLYVWLMDGTTLVGEQFLSEAATLWRVSATGDFNGDGKTDLVWQHPDTGQLYAWLLDGLSIIGERSLTPGVIDPNWRIAGAGDMNRDGKSDLVWQNMATGVLAYWLMDSYRVIESGSLNPGATGTSWHIKAVADFDRDGYPDLVWQNVNSGQLYVWFMHGPDLWNDRFLTPSAVGPGWEIVGGK